FSLFNLQLNQRIIEQLLAADRYAVGQQTDAPLNGIIKDRVVAKLLVLDSERPIQNIFQIRLRDRPIYPVKRDIPQIVAPNFFVVRNHKVSRDSIAEGVINPILEIIDFFLAAVMKRMYETNQAIF